MTYYETDCPEQYYPRVPKAGFREKTGITLMLLGFTLAMCCVYIILLFSVQPEIALPVWASRVVWGFFGFGLVAIALPVGLIITYRWQSGELRRLWQWMRGR